MPKLFISYSWTSPEYQEKVISLASRLRENGVDVILDKWHLREGHDAYAFMEQMVNDPAVDKVAILSNRTYVERANGRNGGVGAETQILTPELYKKKDQSKFVVVVMERSEDDRPIVPAYYASRIHIDLSQPADSLENFERLLRWIYDKPVHTPPPIGKPPAFLDADSTNPALGTAMLFRRAQDAVRNHKPYALAAAGEYFERFAADMERFRIQGNGDDIDEAVIANLQAFLPYRDECVALIYNVATNINGADAATLVHRFLENIARYMYAPATISTYNRCDFDNFKFIVNEFFLYTISIFIKSVNFKYTSVLLGEYYAPYASGNPGNAMESYHIFREYIESLGARNRRLKLNRLSVHADLLKERCSGAPVSFNEIMQADFVLYLRSIIKLGTPSWFPETLVYASAFSGPFEIFARAKSRRYLEGIQSLLGAASKTDIDKAVATIEKNRDMQPFLNGQIRSASLRRLMGYEYLGLSD